MSEAEPWIRTRVREITAELNKALAIAREQKVPVQIDVIKTLGSPPEYSVAMVELPPVAPEPDNQQTGAST